MSTKTTELFNLAKTTMSHAYSPYSGFKVGAAVLMSDGQAFGGCNVENASYGGTVCAERIALFSAIAHGSSKSMTEIVVITDNQEPWPPCGFCRQVMAEFAVADCKVHLANLEGINSTILFSQLFPSAFSPAHLK